MWFLSGTPPPKKNPGSAPANKQGSLCRLYNLNKKLEREGLTTEYNQVGTSAQTSYLGTLTWENR